MNSQWTVDTNAIDVIIQVNVNVIDIIERGSALVMT